MAETIVVALGGNAILQPKQKGTYEEQYRNVLVTAQQIAALVQQGYNVVVTHGNGPQVGNLLIQNDRAKDIVAPMPMDVCGAETQGMIGYLLQQCLGNLLQHDRPVVTLVTQVLVDEQDPAFQNPTKPVGPFYTADEAERLMAEKGYQMKEDAGRGWRRVVPSPNPVGIVEEDAIRILVRAGALVIASGGGGVPVVRRGGTLVGVEAVIDKDLAAQRLALAVGASKLVIVTDVPRVSINYRKPNETALERITVTEARKYAAQGHFAPGSMGPKVEAAIRFLEAGGEEALITSLNCLAESLTGRMGTRILPDRRALIGSLPRTIDLEL